MFFAGSNFLIQEKMVDFLLKGFRKRHIFLLTIDFDLMCGFWLSALLGRVRGPLR